MEVNKQKMRYLKSELREYEKVTPMTEDERKALHEWVESGNSVHENGCYAVNEGGFPLDFLEVYREDAELRSETRSMTSEEIDRYIYDNYGIERYCKEEGELWEGLS